MIETEQSTILFVLSECAWFNDCFILAYKTYSLKQGISPLTDLRVDKGKLNWRDI